MNRKKQSRLKYIGSERPGAVAVVFFLEEIAIIILNYVDDITHSK